LTLSGVIIEWIGFVRDEREMGGSDEREELLIPAG